MAGQIKMTPEEVRASANQYRQQAEIVNGVITKMDTLLTQLQGQWEGSGSQSYASRYADLKPGFTRAEELINEIATALDAAANAIERGDAEAARQFGG